MNEVRRGRFPELDAQWVTFMVNFLTILVLLLFALNCKMLNGGSLNGLNLP